MTFPLPPSGRPASEQTSREARSQIATAVRRALPWVIEMMALGGSLTHETHRIPRGPLSCGRGRSKHTLWAGRVTDTEAVKYIPNACCPFEPPLLKQPGHRWDTGKRRAGEAEGRRLIVDSPLAPPFPEEMEKLLLDLYSTCVIINAGMSVRLLHSPWLGWRVSN